MQHPVSCRRQNVNKIIKIVSSPEHGHVEIFFWSDFNVFEFFFPFIFFLNLNNFCRILTYFFFFFRNLVLYNFAYFYAARICRHTLSYSRTRSSAWIIQIFDHTTVFMFNNNTIRSMVRRHNTTFSKTHDLTYYSSIFINGRAVF